MTDPIQTAEDLLHIILTQYGSVDAFLAILRVDPSRDTIEFAPVTPATDEFAERLCPPEISLPPGPRHLLRSSE